MSYPNMRLTKETKINPKEEFEFKDSRDFADTIGFVRYADGDIVSEAQLDIKRLHKIINEWRLLSRTRKVVELEILQQFEGHQTGWSLPVSEIRNYLTTVFKKNISNARIHLALKRLIKDEQLKKISRGVYRKLW